MFKPKEKGILREKAMFWNMVRNVLSQVDSNKEVIVCIFYLGTSGQKEQFQRDGEKTIT